MRRSNALSRQRLECAGFSGAFPRVARQSGAEDAAIQTLRDSGRPLQIHDKPPRLACFAERACGSPQPENAVHREQMPWLTQVWPESLPPLRLKRTADTAPNAVSKV